jgi:uncharacterized protein (DUF433 family)
MGNSTATLPFEPGIISIPLIEGRDGVLRVIGTRLTYDTVIEAFKLGLAPDEIVRQYPSLTLGNVYLLIGYYLQHSAELDRYLDDRRQTVESNSRKVESAAESSSSGLSERVKHARSVVRKHEFSTLAQKWADYVRARRNLEAASFTRSHKTAEAALAEWLVQFVFHGELAPSRSNPRYDVVAGNMRIEVKSISKSADNPKGYKIKSKDKTNDPATGATHYAFLFYDNFVPDVLFLVPAEFVSNFRRPQIKRADLEKESSNKVDIDLTPFRAAVAS